MDSKTDEEFISIDYDESLHEEYELPCSPTGSSSSSSSLETSHPDLSIILQEQQQLAMLETANLMQVQRTLTRRNSLEDTALDTDSNEEVPSVDILPAQLSLQQITETFPEASQKKEGDVTDDWEPYIEAALQQHQVMNVAMHTPDDKNVQTYEVHPYLQEHKLQVLQETSEMEIQIMMNSSAKILHSDSSLEFTLETDFLSTKHPASISGSQEQDFNVNPVSNEQDFNVNPVSNEQDFNVNPVSNASDGLQMPLDEFFKRETCMTNAIIHHQLKHINENTQYEDMNKSDKQDIVIQSPQCIIYKTETNNEKELNIVSSEETSLSNTAIQKKDASFVTECTQEVNTDEEIGSQVYTEIETLQELGLEVALPTELVNNPTPNTEQNVVIIEVPIEQQKDLKASELNEEDKINHLVKQDTEEFSDALLAESNRTDVCTSQTKLNSCTSKETNEINSEIVDGYNYTEVKELMDEIGVENTEMKSFLNANNSTMDAEKEDNFLSEATAKLIEHTTKIRLKIAPTKDITFNSIGVVGSGLMTEAPEESINSQENTEIKELEELGMEAVVPVETENKTESENSEFLKHTEEKKSTAISELQNKTDSKSVAQTPGGGDKLVAEMPEEYIDTQENEEIKELQELGTEAVVPEEPENKDQDDKHGMNTNFSSIKIQDIESHSTFEIQNQTYKTKTDTQSSIDDQNTEETYLEEYKLNQFHTQTQHCLPENKKIKLVNTSPNLEKHKSNVVCSTESNPNTHTTVTSENVFNYTPDSNSRDQDKIEDQTVVNKQSYQAMIDEIKCSTTETNWQLDPLSYSVIPEMTENEEDLSQPNTEDYSIYSSPEATTGSQVLDPTPQFDDMDYVDDIVYDNCDPYLTQSTVKSENSENLSLHNTLKLSQDSEERMDCIITFSQSKEDQEMKSFAELLLPQQPFIDLCEMEVAAEASQLEASLPIESELPQMASTEAAIPHYFTPTSFPSAKTQCNVTTDTLNVIPKCTFTQTEDISTFNVYTQTEIVMEQIEKMMRGTKRCTQDESGPPVKVACMTPSNSKDLKKKTVTLDSKDSNASKLAAKPVRKSLRLGLSRCARLNK